MTHSLAPIPAPENPRRRILKRRGFWLLGVTLLLLAGPATGRTLDGETPANVRYLAQESRARLQPRYELRGHRTETLPLDAPAGFVRVKLRDGIVVRTDEEGTLVESPVDLQSLGLDGATWHASWHGTREERTRVWAETEEALGLRLPDPTTFYLLELPPGVTVFNAVSALQDVDEVEAVSALPVVRSLSGDSRLGNVAGAVSNPTGLPNAKGAFEEHGITGRQASLFLIELSPPLQGVAQLPEYTTLPFGAPISDLGPATFTAQRLSLLGAPIDLVGGTGIAPHATFGLGFWTGIQQGGNNTEWVFDPRVALEAVRQFAGPGDVLVLSHCVGRSTSSGLSTGCVPVEADIWAWDSIATLSNAGVTVVEWAGADVFSVEYPLQSRDYTLFGWPPNCNPFYCTVFPSPYDSGAIIAGVGNGSETEGNWGDRVDVKAINGSTDVAGVAALAQSAVKHVGISTSGGNSGAYIRGPDLRAWGSALRDAPAAVERALQLAEGRSASLRLHGPLTGWGPTIRYDEQNVPISLGDTVELPDTVTNAGGLEFPFKVFNDGFGTLDVDVRIDYDPYDPSDPNDPVSNRSPSNPFSVVTAMPEELVGRTGMELILKFDPSHPGPHTGTVVISSNDSRAPVFTFDLNAKGVGASGLVWDVVDIDGAPIPNDVVDFGEDVDWYPVETGSPDHYDGRPTRLLQIVNFGSETIEVTVDFPSISELPTRYDLAKKGFHFLRTVPLVAPRDFKLVLGPGEDADLGFEFLNYEIGTSTATLTLSAKPAGTSLDPEVRTLTLRGSVRDWPEELKVMGCDGELYDIPLGGMFRWDLGAVDRRDLDVPLSQKLKFWSKERGTIQRITDSVDPLFPDRGSAPVGLRFVKKLMDYVEWAEGVVELHDEARTLLGNKVRAWQVEVDFDVPTPFRSYFLSYSMRPFLPFGDGSFTLVSRGERTSVTYDPETRSNLCGRGSEDSTVEKQAGEIGPGSLIPPGHTHDFGSLTAGQTASETYTITNSSSTSSLVIQDFLIEGGAFSGTLPKNTLAPGESVDIVVEFRASAPGLHEGWMSFEVDGSGVTNPFWIGRLRGRVTRPQAPVPVVTGPDGRVIPNGGEYHFPAEIKRNAQAVTRTFTLTNGGLDPLQVSNLSLTGTGMWLDDGEQINEELETGDSVTFRVAMEVVAEGAKLASLTFDTNASPTRQGLILKGNVVEADLSDLLALEVVATGERLLEGSVLQFPDVEAHGVSKVRVRATNNGYDPVDPSYSIGGSFALDAQSFPSGSTTVAPGESFEFDLWFWPGYAGEHSGRVTLRQQWHFPDGVRERAELVIGLAGTALPSPGNPDIRLETAEGEPIPNGGVFEVGQGAPYEQLRRTLRIVNIGAQDVVLGRWTLADPENHFDYDPFQRSNKTLVPGESFEITVSLNETEPGVYEAYFFTNDFDVLLKAVLGEGVELEIGGQRVEAAGRHVDFPEVVTPEDSTLEAVVRNSGFAAVDLGAVRLAEGTRFEIVNPPAPQRLEPGQEAPFTLRLLGQISGDHLDRLDVPIDTLEGEQKTLSAGLRGRVWPSTAATGLLGVYRQFSTDPEYALRHGDALRHKEIGPSSPDVTFERSWTLYVANVGDAPLSLLDISGSSGRLRAETSGSVLDPGRGTSLRVYFSAQTPGEYIEELTLTTDDPFSPMTLKVPVTVHERSVIELRGPAGNPLPSGFTFQTGTLSTSSLGWHLPVTVLNRGPAPLYVQVDAECDDGSAPLDVWSGIYRIPQDESAWPLIRVEREVASPVRCTIAYHSSDRAGEPFILKLVGSVSGGGSPGSGQLLVRTGPNDNLPLPNGGPRFELPATSWSESTARVRLYNVAPSGSSNLQIREEDVVLEGAYWGGADLFANSSLGIRPGRSFSLYFDLNAVGPGRYPGRLVIHSNDPRSPYVIDFRRVVLADGPLAQVEDIFESPVARGGVYTFPDVSEGATVSRALFVYNAGDYPVRLGDDGIRVEGDGFSLIQQPEPSAVIEPNRSAVFRVRFRKNLAGTYQGQVSFGTNEGLGTYRFDLTATVVTGTSSGSTTEPDIRVFRNWDDQPVAAGTTVVFEGGTATGEPTSRRFRIENHGAADLAISNPSTVVSGDCFSLIEQPAESVASGDVTYFRVRLHCPTRGEKLGGVDILSDDPDQSPFSFTVSGTVEDETPEMTVSQAWDGVAVASGGGFDFGETTVTGDPISRRFRIDNAGEAELVIDNPTALVSGACFHLIEEPATTVPIGGTTYFRVRLMCGTAGTHTGQVTILGNDPGSGGSFTFSVTGTVEERVTEIAVAQAWDGAPVPSGGSFTFAKTPKPGETVSYRFRIDNPGTADLVLADPAGLVGGECFSQIEQPDPNIPAGASGFFRVRLGCAKAGPKTGTVSIVADDPSIPAYTFLLAGTVLDPEPLVQVRQVWDGAILSPGATATLPGSFPVEKPVTAGSFVLENPGAETLYLLDPSGLVGGLCFSLADGWVAPASIPAGGSVELPIQVYCGETGLVTGELRVTTSLDGASVDGLYSAGLAATLEGPELRVVRGWPDADPTEVAGGDSVALPVVAPAGDPGTSVAFQIHNDGVGELLIQNVGPDLVTGECFEIRAGGYPATAVPAGGSTPFRVWWGESCGPGTYTATVTVRSNDGDEDPLTFTVVGQVEPPPPVVEVVQNWDLVPVADGSTIDFPKAVSVDVASSAAFQLTNPLSETLTFDPSSGVTGDCFSITSGESIPASLDAGASGLFRVKVLCGSAGEKPGTVTLLTSTASQTHAPFTFTVRALVDSPELRVVRGWPDADPTEIVAGAVIDLPTVAVAGDVNHSVAFQIHNSGLGTLVIDNPDSSLVSGTCFSMRSGGFPAAEVAPGDFTPFRVWWGGSCTEPGTYTATVSVLSNDPDEDPLTFEVRGQVAAVPVLTCQPADARVAAGQPATFTVCTAEPSGTLTYSWFKDGQAIADGDATLSLPAVTETDEGAYHVEVANEAGSVVSQTATLTVVEKPVVSQPADQTVNAGGTATFSVTVSSPPEDGPFSYVWQELPPGAATFQTIAGETTDTLTVSGVTTTMDGSFYRCLVSNEAGQTNPGRARLTVVDAPVITQQPQSQRVVVGSNVSFSVTATGSPAPTYLWRKDGVTNSVTTPTLSLSAVTDADEGLYKVRVTNSEGWVDSQGATLTVVEKPVVSRPANQSAPVGGSATFSVTVSSPAEDGPFTYRWQQLPPGASTFQTLSGATSASLTVSNITLAMDGTKYRCLVSNDAGQTSSFAGTLTVLNPDVQVTRAWDGGTVGEGTTFDFGTAERGVATSRRFKITNTGQATLSISNRTSFVSGTCWSQIEYAAASVAPGASTYFRVRLQCNTTGTKNGTITIYSNDPSSPYRFDVRGTVVPSDVTVYRAWNGVVQGEGSTFLFPDTETGTAVSRRFRITNTGQATLTLSNPTSLVSGTCWSQIENAASTVAPGASTYFRVRLQCNSAGTKSGTVTLYSNDPSSPYRFNLQGTVTEPDPGNVTVYRAWNGVVQGEGTTFPFPDTTTGSAVSRRFRITNTGSGTLTISNPTSFVSGTCWSQIENAASSVAPGASTYFRVRLLCSSTGTKTGTITIYSNDTSSPYRFYVQGTVN